MRRGKSGSEGVARPLRIELPAGLYHVMSRGNVSSGHRPRLSQIVSGEWIGCGATVETCGCRLHAFVLITAYCRKTPPTLLSLHPLALMQRPPIGVA